MSKPSKTPKTPARRGAAGTPGTAWLSLDELVLAGPVPLAQTRVAQSIVGDPTGGGGGGGGGGGCCCCCCCCCCKPEPPPEPPPVDELPPVVSLRADAWEQLVDPGDLAAGVQAIRGELRWRARGPEGTRVDVEIRSEDHDGQPSGRYPEWTPLLAERSPVDVATVVLDRRVGDRVRLRASASSPGHPRGLSEVLALRLAR